MLSVPVSLPCGRTARVSAVDELYRDERTEFMRAAPVRFAPARDRVAFPIDAVRGMARRGDTQVGHGAEEEVGDVV